MLPDLLASSYRRYKEDTNVFTTWLYQAAQACGWKPSTKPQPVASGSPVVDVPRAPRLKGKQRKLAREAAKAGNQGSNSAGQDALSPALTYKITTGELIRQTAVLAEWTK